MIVSDQVPSVKNFRTVFRADIVFVMAFSFFELKNVGRSSLSIDNGSHAHSS